MIKHREKFRQPRTPFSTAGQVPLSSLHAEALVLPSTLPSPGAIRLPKSKPRLPLPERTLVRFELHSESAREVCVAGSFNAWRPVVMQKCDDSAWSAYLSLASGQHEYRFIVDGVWQEDPCAAAQIPNPFCGRNSVITVP